MHDDDTTPIMAARWWEDRMQGSGLGWLQDTNYILIDHNLICAFVERSHEETSSFHLLFGDMTVILDNVSCLLHLTIYDMLLSHSPITRDTVVEWMVEQLGSDSSEALVDVTQTKGVHCRFNCLRRIFKDRMLE